LPEKPNISARREHQRSQSEDFPFLISNFSFAIAGQEEPLFRKWDLSAKRGAQVPYLNNGLRTLSHDK
jgi:hypothetical protein